MVLSAFCLLGLLGATSGCGAAEKLAASLRSTDHFVAYPADPRVLYEPGAEAFAPKVAPLLPAAIAKVESGQYLPFRDPVKVYLCASEDSYYKLTGARSRAVVTSKLFLSRRLLEEKPPLVKLYLTHELSHLHLHQRLGMLRRVELPSWFKEGLATLVSGGGGAQKVTDAQAIAAIKQGQLFIPDESRGVLASFLFPRYGSYWNLDQQMFYRQAMLFVGFLHQRDKAAFRSLLLAIQAGAPFSVSLSKSYGMELADL